jgi:hypothetical protein
MYDAPFDLGVVIGWILVAVVVVLLAARAVRTEWRATRPGPRTVGVRVLDAGLDVALFVAVVGLLATLLAVIVATFAAFG